MDRSAPYRFGRQTGVALLPAVLMFCCAGRAAAECGDYVRILGPDGTAQPMPGHEPKPADQPCHGPFCHGGPKAPNPVPPAPVSPIPDPKGLVSDAGGGPDDDAATRFDREPGGSPVRQSTSIFHPPRAS
jgi:hypothetical protein